MMLIAAEHWITYPGSTDTVRYWSYLGFVKKYPGLDPPVYLESERRQLPPVMTDGSPL
jgi:hypothetical protein